jgi:hypothetical protein
MTDVHTSCATVGLAELDQRLPRKVRLAAMGVYYLLGSTIVSAAILALLICGISLDIRNAKRSAILAREGQLTYANKVWTIGNYDATVRYTFRFDGNAYEGEAEVPREYRNKVKKYCVTGNLPILFLAADPSVNHPSEWRDTFSVRFLEIGMTFILLIQWSALGKFIYREWQLVRFGLVAIGKVQKCTHGRSAGTIVRYEFRGLDDIPISGKGEYPKPIEADAQIPVLYLPGEEGNSRPYPLVLFRTARRARGASSGGAK